MCRMVGMVAAPPPFEEENLSAAGAASPVSPDPHRAGTRRATLLPSWEHLVGAPRALRVQPCVSDENAGEAWGVGWFDAGGQVSLVRQVGRAEDSAFYVFAAESAGRSSALSGPATVLIAHRQPRHGGNSGSGGSESAHPLRADFARRQRDDAQRQAGASAYDTLLVAHNGGPGDPLLAGLRAELLEARRVEAARAPSGSAVLAGWLALRAEESSDGLFEALAGALHALIRRGAAVPNGDSSPLALLIAHNSGDLFALRHAAGPAASLNRAPYRLLARPGRPGEGAAFVVASEPTDDAPGWEPLAPGELVRFGARGAIRNVRVA
jgi:predicted glutamine amidotransferase